MSLEATPDRQFIRMLEPGGAVHEHFRELAENLLALERAGSVVVTSLEPGDGRTSVCVGLGWALAQRGVRAALVDCNIGAPQLHRVFGEPNFVGLTSALERGKPLEDCGFLAGGSGRGSGENPEGDPEGSLLVVPTGPVMSGAEDLLYSPGLAEAVEGLRESREVVLLDAPVVARVLESRSLCTGFDGLLMVIHAERTPKSLARQFTDDLLESGANIFGAVLNGGGQYVR